jgi:DNA-binding beta-propeller fold protein YncE
MFVVGFSTDAVFEYTLSTGFDISTATFSQSFSVASQETSPTGIAFSPDGTKMFVTGYVGDDMNEYTLTTGFDVSTASFTQNFSIAGEEIFPTGVAFNTDGTKMFISGQGGDDVNEYDLSTGFDLSTASYSQSFSVAAQDDSPYGITFNSDGTKLFVLGTQNDKVYQYSLTTGFDISTASFASDFSITQDTSPTGIDFNNDGTKFFVVGAGSDTVYQYSTTPVSTTVLAGKALSSTSINLDYTT